MKTASKKSCAIIALVIAGLVSPQVHAEQAATQEEAKGKGLFMLLALPVLKEVLGNYVKEQGGGIFKEWGCKLFSIGKACDKTSGLSNVRKLPAQDESPMKNLSAEEIEQLARAPAFLIQFDRLSDDSPQAGVLGTEAMDSTPEGQRKVTVQTGESFALRFGATAPGRVRLINTDATGRVEQIGYYEIRAGVERRVPTAGKGGIRMTPPEGQEYLDVEYEPCISRQMLLYPDVAKFKNDLPACDLKQPDEKRWQQGQAYVAPESAKGMSNPDAVNAPDLGVAIAPPDYNAKALGSILRWRIVFDHQPATLKPVTASIPQ